VRDLRDDFAREAARLTTGLLARDTVDGVPEIAQAFPLRVFAAAVGLAETGGDELLAYGNMAFNAFGPRNQLTTESLRQAAEVGAWIAARCTREALAPGGLGARIYDSVDDGSITPSEAALLVRSLLTAGVDTTVIGLGLRWTAWPATRPSGSCCAPTRDWRAPRSRSHSGTPRPCRPSSAPPPGR
jgi:cytochrome P450